jgi:hypothetical protein
MSQLTENLPLFLTQTIVTKLWVGYGIQDAGSGKILFQIRNIGPCLLFWRYRPEP